MCRSRHKFKIFGYRRFQDVDALNPPAIRRVKMPIEYREAKGRGWQSVPIFRFSPFSPLPRCLDTDDDDVDDADVVDVDWYGRSALRCWPHFLPSENRRP